MSKLKWRRKYTFTILCSSSSSVRKARTLFVHTACPLSIPYSRVALNAATNVAICTSAGIATGATLACTGRNNPLPRIRTLSQLRCDSFGYIRHLIEHQ